MSMRRTWSTAEVEAEATRLASTLGHFPTNSELRAIGRNDLAMQITRRGGFAEMAKRLGIDRIESASDLGWDGERAVCERLTARGFSVTGSRGVRSPYDLIVDGVVRVDVKTAARTTYRHNGDGSFSGWFYRIGKYVQSDVVILFQKDTGACYVLPWWVCNATNITLCGLGGIYAEYRNAFHIIDSMVASRAQERDALCAAT
jgi:hypothetical protein